MTMKTLSVLLWGVVLAGATSVAVMQSGCLLVAAGAAGAGTVAYVRGELTAALSNGYESVVRASNRAIDGLQFKKISEAKDALKAVLIARTADDKKVEITITKESDALTKVEIRVGVFGDERLSLTVLDKIKARL